MDSTDKMISLLRRLGEGHRPVREQMPEANPGTLAWHCPAGCYDGRHFVWQEGDPTPGCDLWREYHAYWVRDE